MKHQLSLGPADTIICTCEEGPTAQLCGDSEVAGKWINCQYSLRLKYKGKICQIRKTNVVTMVEKEDRQSHLED